MVKKTVLVTGGLGFIGGGLCHYLSKVGFDVIIGSSRKDAFLPSELSTCLLAFVDLQSYKSLLKVCDKVDYVVHLASIDAQKSLSDPTKAIKVNANGTDNLVKACIATNIEYFLYFSTAHIYGSNLKGRVDENTSPSPINTYSESHKLAEDFLVKAFSKKELSGLILRLSNSVGLPLIKPDSSKLFLNDICRQAIENQSIKINSNPYIERDFISLDSVYIAVKAILSRLPESSLPIFNFGSGITHSLLSIANIVIDRCEYLFNITPELLYQKKYTKNDFPLEYSNEKFINKFCYKPDTRLYPSIEEVLKFHASKQDI